MALPGMFEQLPPEWPGAGPARFTDKLTAHPLSRKIVTCDTRNGDPTSLARQGFVRYFNDPAGLVPPESKRIVGQRQAEVCAWRPSRRTLSEPGAQHWEKPEGLKHVEAAPGKVVSIREKRHVRQVSSKEEYGDRNIGPRTCVREHNGLRASDQPAQEIDISREMQHKRQLNTLVSQRNQIGCRALGDKCYKHPDYERGFHHAGGLIVGAGFVRGSYERTAARNSISVPVEAEFRHIKSYAEKMRERKPLEACDVEALTMHWESKELKMSSDTNALFVDAMEADERADRKDEGIADTPEASPR